ncbi:unnamed protein product [Rotaria socialis]|uniref:Uncharacterized protein n=1 Tax=Rotaria socialis TaxID=392032 RepID=A0A820ICA2_9BILA|nr:unnamed protein product [Rotaria socialis]CAF3423991.1 unnamed protein product [Rotaria socialis]CAF3711436.1 unnamed protein product [Rotaria socialis]CAF4309787.1 unnamed protein product [Rotaria socialis]CAF4618625.1 unnamed protein product [Rotaria socialis]
MSQVEEESIDDIELIHEQSIDVDEIIDLNTNFNISQTEYSPTELGTDLSAHCNSSVSTDDELLIFDDILQSNDSNNVQPLHCHTNISTSKCCRQLVKYFLDSNISNVHASRINKLFNAVLPQPYNAPKSLKALYDSINGEILY